MTNQPLSSSRSYPYQGKTALITGASTGIGKALATQLAARGCAVILVARSHDLLEQLANHLTTTYGVKTTVIVKDLSVPGAAQALHDDIVQQGLAVHLLVNNAGFGSTGPVAESDFQIQQQMTTLNMVTVSDLVHLFLPTLLAQTAVGVPCGIINVGSVAGFIMLPNMALYAATKAFVFSFGMGLWAEVRGQGVRVLTLCPAQTATNFFDRDAMASLQSVANLKNFDTPEEVAVQGLQAFSAGQPFVITNLPMKVFVRLSYVVPKKWLTILTRRLFSSL